MQPMAYGGDPTVENLNINSPAGQARQINTQRFIHSLEELASQASIDFLDLTRVFDSCFGIISIYITRLPMGTRF